MKCLFNVRRYIMPELSGMWTAQFLTITKLLIDSQTSRRTFENMNVSFCVANIKRQYLVIP